MLENVVRDKRHKTKKIITIVAQYVLALKDSCWQSHSKLAKAARCNLQTETTNVDALGLHPLHEP